MKGFLNIALAIGLGALALGISLFGIYKANDIRLGATVYTTQLTDTIGTFRNQVNSSTANLNAELVAVSTTIHTYGTIVTANSPLPIANGGTATTTAPSANQFFSANSAVPTWKSLVAGSGMTISSGNTSTVFSTQGIDTTSTFSWTGLHTFLGGLISNSSSFTGVLSATGTLTLGGNITFNTNPTMPNNFPNGLIAASTTDISAPANTTTTIFSVTIPTSTIATQGSMVEIFVEISGGTVNTTNETSTLTLSYGGVPIISGVTWNDSNGGGDVLSAHITGLIISGGTATQESRLIVQMLGTTSVIGISNSASTVSATSSKTLLLQVKPTQASTQSLTIANWYVRVTK